MLLCVMTAAKFEWDDNKDAENQAKHHVSFQDAQAAFADQQPAAAFGNPKQDRVHGAGA